MGEKSLKFHSLKTDLQSIVGFFGSQHFSALVLARIAPPHIKVEYSLRIFLDLYLLLRAGGDCCSNVCAPGSRWPFYVFLCSRKFVS